MNTLPVWTIPPDWANGISEKLEWKSDVLQSALSGAEQRRQLRITPRRTFELPFVLVGTTRTLFDLATGAVGTQDWLLPVWHESHRLPADLAAGSLSIPVPGTAASEFVVGPALLMTDPFTYEVVTISAVGTDALTVAATANDWLAGTRLYPLVQAFIPALTQVSGSRAADRALTVTVPFQLSQANPFAAVALTTTYRDYPVLLTPPDHREDLSYALDRFSTTLDNQVSVPFRLDTAGLSVSVLQHRWYVRGRAQHIAMRSLFYALAGKVAAVWLPTFFADFDLALDVAAADLTLTVRQCGFTRFGGPRVGRQAICIQLRDGVTAYFATITGASQSVSTEILTIDAALGAAVAVSDVKRISFMALSRQDADLVEFMHYTDSQGLSTVSTVFRSTPENRVAADYTPYEPCGGVYVPVVVVVTLTEPTGFYLGFKTVTNLLAASKALLIDITDINTAMSPNGVCTVAIGTPSIALAYVHHTDDSKAVKPGQAYLAERTSSSGATTLTNHPIMTCAPYDANSFPSGSGVVPANLLTTGETTYTFTLSTTSAFGTTGGPQATSLGLTPAFSAGWTCEIGYVEVDMNIQVTSSDSITGVLSIEFPAGSTSKAPTVTGDAVAGSNYNATVTFNSLADIPDVIITVSSTLFVSVVFGTSGVTGSQAVASVNEFAVTTYLRPTTDFDCSIELVWSGTT